MDDNLIPFPATHRDKASHAARLMSSRLREYLIEQHVTTAKNRRWHSAFETLIQRHTERVVWEKLNAYIRFKLTVPTVRCGQDFADQWEWVCDEIHKRQLTELAGEPTEAAQLILLQLTEYSWPERARRELPGAVQRSVDEYIFFLRRLIDLTDLTSTQRNIREWLKTELTEPVDYITRWFVNLFRRLGKCNGWTGALSSHVWSPVHVEFVDSVRMSLNNYGADYKHWQDIVARVGKR